MVISEQYTFMAQELFDAMAAGQDVLDATEYGIPFKAGEIILSGSLVPLQPAARGDKMTMNIAGFGSCDVEFV